MRSRFPFMNRKLRRAGHSNASPGRAVRDFLRLAVTGNLGNGRFQAIEGLLQNTPRGGKADAQMSGRSGTKPARRAWYQGDVRLLTELLAQPFCIVAEAVD